MENAEKVKDFGEEVLRYIVAELHVHAILSGAVIATAHKIEEGKVGIIVSGVLISSMFVIKRRYPHRLFHLVRLDRAYLKARGRIVTIDGQDYKHHKGFLTLHNY